MRFADAAVERAYREHHAVATRVLVRAATTLALVGWCLVGLIDHRIGGSPENTEVIATWRFAVIAPIQAALLAWTFTPAALYRRTYEAGMAFGIFAMLGGIAMISLRMPTPAQHAFDQAVGGFLLIAMGAATITSLRFVPFVMALAPSLVAMAAVTAVRYPAATPTVMVWLAVCALTSMASSWLLESMRRRAWLSACELAVERERSEQLLRHVLPEAIAERLKREPGRRIAELHPAATVLFADMVGFTALAERVPPAELVAALDEIFSGFDALAERHGLEKIKTIGDAYMVVGGVPAARADHAQAVADMALGMRAALEARRALAGERILLRIGIHTGPVVAGVIGKQKLVYDLWGDTVNLASRMESHGVEDGIQVTEATRALLGDAYVCEPRGVVAVKGKGELRTWLLVGRRSDGARP